MGKHQKTIRIITNVHIPNNGGVLFVDSLTRALAEKFPDNDIKVIDYIPLNMQFNIFKKFVKPFRKAPLYYLQRYVLFEKFTNAHLALERSLPLNKSYRSLVGHLEKQNYDAIIVAMDIWNVNDDLSYLAKFPNIYWLSETIASKKIAYAISGYRSDPRHVDQHSDQIRAKLNGFDLIGVRDDLTEELVKDRSIDPAILVERVPDLTFLYQPQPTQVLKRLTDYGINISQPILGLMVYRKDELSKRIREVYKAKGYQIIALSHYNPFADVNLGHRLTPFEWAEVIKHLTFCITDRFHGSIFCLLGDTPFVAIEPYPLVASIKNSKIFTLLSEFEMSECRLDVLTQPVDYDQFFRQLEAITNDWEEKYSSKIKKKVAEMQARNKAFLDQIETVLDS